MISSRCRTGRSQVAEVLAPVTATTRSPKRRAFWPAPTGTIEEPTARAAACRYRPRAPKPGQVARWQAPGRRHAEIAPGSRTAASAALIPPPAPGSPHQEGW